MEIQVIFDRDNRLYRIGEIISGRVIVVSEYDCTFSGMWIIYQWRTHGWGYRDQGKEENLISTAKNISFRAGECRKFRFQFPAPNGPVTYHGHLLNVDWYLTAHAQRGSLIHIKSEQDFLLFPGDPTGAVVLGTKEISFNELPARSTNMLPKSNSLVEIKSVSHKPQGFLSKLRNELFGLLIIGFMVTPAILLARYLGWNSDLGWGILFVILFILAAVVQALFRKVYKHKFELGEVWVKPVIIYPGSEVYCHVDFVAKRGFHLRSIMASISYKECIERQSGTKTATEIYVLDEKSYTKTFKEDLFKGSRISFDCTLPVGKYAPASFSSPNNA